MIPRRVLLLALSFAFAVAAHAMSVVPPTFDELVAEADTVVRGTVTDVHAELIDTPQGQGIQTLVTLRVERALKGSPGETVTLRLLGGRVGKRNLRVEGMPAFHLGDRQIVFFAHNGSTICPLIAAGHGRYHVKRDLDSGRDFVARDNGAPLVSTDEVRQSLDASPNPHATSSARALAPADFETRIAETVAAQAARPALQR